MKHLAKILVALLLSAGLATAQADLNPNIGGDQHTHSAKATGKITSYRVQQQGVEFGAGDDRLDAEVIITLDSEPDKAFGVRYHEGATPANDAMVRLLEEAFIHRFEITVFHVLPPGKKNLSILWVEARH